jgi:hypothetical protein
MAELGPLLTLKNGFYAFESALHVLPFRPTSGERGLEEWNSFHGWRADYQGLANDGVFFAEDVFGVQFCLVKGAVATFDPETGEKVTIAPNLVDWARRVLGDYEELTGYPLAHEWQIRNGPLPRGQRLVPKTPFVLGGEFTTENVFLLDAERAMHARAAIAMQIRDLPDGTDIVLKVVD